MSGKSVGGRSHSKNGSNNKSLASSCNEDSHTDEGQHNDTDGTEPPADESTDQRHLDENVGSSVPQSHITQEQIDEGTASASNVGANNCCIEDQLNEVPNQKNISSAVSGTDVTVEDSKIIKLEKENILLKKSLTHLSDRIGDEHLSDSSEDSVGFDDGPPIIVTTNYQLDNILAPNFYFICNVSSFELILFRITFRNLHLLFNQQSAGFRYYMDGKIKLSPETINKLKKLNDTYPSCTDDYDIRFLFHLLKAVFTNDEIIQCSQTSSIQYLDRAKLKFVKGIRRIDFILVLSRM